MKIRHPLLTKALGRLGTFPLHTLARTLTYHIHEEHPRTHPADPQAPRNYLYALWHDIILIPIIARRGIRFPGRRTSVSALVSQHQDGTYLVQALNSFWIDAVRGSTSRGGAQAVRRLLDEVQQAHVFITPDGPRGPRRQMKDGILYLASQTGTPIIPTGFAAPSAWTIRGSWTDLVIPKPFASVYGVLGSPFVVPPDISREELADYRQRLQAEMDRLDARAARIANGTDEASEPHRAAA